LCCERLRQQRSGEISIPLAAGSGGVATPGYGAGSGEELVAEVVSDAGDVGAHDDGLVVVQVEAEEGGVSGGLAVVPGDGLATVVAGDLGPYVVAMRSSTPSCSAVGDGPGQIDEPSMVELAPHGARALLARSKNSE